MAEANVRVLPIGAALKQILQEKAPARVLPGARSQPAGVVGQVIQAVKIFYLTDMPRQNAAMFNRGFVATIR